MRFRTRLRTLLLGELLLPLVAVVMILLIGFFGIMYFEKLSPLQSLYLLVITLATIGYGDVVPVTPEGKIFIIILI